MAKPRAGPSSASGSGWWWLKYLLVVLVAWTAKLAMDWHRDAQLTRPWGEPVPVVYGTRWGTLRSLTYFGLKAPHPNSPVAGLIWFKNEVPLRMRHWCDQGDAINRYTFTRHDYSNFGQQEIIDGDLRLTTDHVISADGTGWSARISAESTKPAEPKKADSNEQKQRPPIHSLIFYLALSEPDAAFEVLESSSDGAFRITGNSSVFDDYTMAVAVEDKFGANVLYNGYVEARSDPPLVRINDALQHSMRIINHAKQELIAIHPNLNQPGANFVAFQVSFHAPLTLNIRFSPAKDPETVSPAFPEAELARHVKNFDDKVAKLLRLDDKKDQDVVKLAKAALSNMLGGIGYFFGYSAVSSPRQPEPVPYGPLELLTAIPSRSFFPRGFLWDEGFHQLLVSKFDPQLSIKIVQSWLNLMNAEGWIPREVILGSEAISRVPAEFVVQNNQNANPPTLFLTLESLIDGGKISSEQLGQIYPRLTAWFDWFNTSQTGPEPGRTYRWRGRDLTNKPGNEQLNPKTLTSGLDDYPRATHPSDEERHVDLLCWMALASRVMAKIAGRIGLDQEQALAFEQTASRLSDNEVLDRLHWDQETRCYADYGNHSPRVRLVRKVVRDEQGKVHELSVRETLEPPKLQMIHECGYISLFPLMTQILRPDNPHLDQLLDSIADRKKLWSDYGLRSISATSHYYNAKNTRDDPPYWRGPIWINANYLTLKALKHYATVDGPYSSKAKQLHDQLRTNLVSNVVRQFKKTGYLWEQYDDQTGKGQRCHPFTGWSALIALIISEDY